MNYECKKCKRMLSEDEFRSHGEYDDMSSFHGWHSLCKQCRGVGERINLRDGTRVNPAMESIKEIFDD